MNWKELKCPHNWCQIVNMRIQPDELISGFPASQIRKLLRQSVEFLSVGNVTRVLGLRGKEALRLLETLEKQGFIEKNAMVSDAEQSWKHTIKGGALSNALFSAPVSRTSAEKKLSEFMERVHRVNEDSRFLFRVRKVVLFGSFLTQSPTIGDLDIAIDLVQKEPDARKHSQLLLARANEAASYGRHFPNYVEGLRFAEQEVIMFLKARSRILQLTRCDDGVLNITENRVIYESPEQNPTVPINPVPKRRGRRSRKIDEDLPF